MFEKHAIIKKMIKNKNLELKREGLKELEVSDETCERVMDIVFHNSIIFEDAVDKLAQELNEKEKDTDIELE